MELFFYDVLDKKATIFEYKNNNFSEGYTSQFSKGVNSRFLSKTSEFSLTYFKGKMSLEIMFLDVLAKKKEFILAPKNNIFPEGQPPAVILVPDINIETRKVM